MRERIRSLVRKVKKHTSVVTTVTPHHPAFRTRWASGLLRALPGERCYVTASLLRVSASGWKRLSTGLAPASGAGTTRLGPDGAASSSALHRPLTKPFGFALSPHPRLTLPRPPHPASRP